MGYTPGQYQQDESIAHVLHEVARAHRILELEGHGDMSMGHLSYRDPFGRGLWLKRGNLALSEVVQGLHGVTPPPVDHAGTR